MYHCVYLRFNRNIFTKNTIFNCADKRDALVFKMVLAIGFMSLFLPWGGQ